MKESEKTGAKKKKKKKKKKAQTFQTAFHSHNSALHSLKVHTTMEGQIRASAVEGHFAISIALSNPNRLSARVIRLW
jgi:Holliday junction resolvase RusA-like endonuclease